MKQLYEVTETYYVMAENEFEADFVGPDFDATTKTVSLANTVESEWVECIPFGGDDDRTCGQILEELKKK